MRRWTDTQGSFSKSVGITLSSIDGLYTKWLLIHRLYYTESGQSMSKEKKVIKWMSYHIDEDELFYEEVYDGDIKEGGETQLEKIPSIISTPWGLYRVNDSMNPYKQFNFWLAHTNFKIDNEAKELLDNIDGIEALVIISQYRFMVARAELFDWRDVRVSIERALCGNYTVDSQLEEIDDQTVSVEVNELVNNLKYSYKYWAIYIFPNGSYEFSCGNQEDVDSFNQSLLTFRQAHKLSGGILLESEAVNEVR